ncbi:MAG: nuclear transport factor 2 family protein, partial [Saprospiraceae bacterium]|nr:nuclear transport factor 2 family protein [Saprospiraceae bacterium]
SDTALYSALQFCDSLVFEVGFNTCDLQQIDKLTSEDFEFYHDQSGITSSKAAFLESVRSNICALSYQPIRQLVHGTMEVYPLHSDGTVYGALQTGIHQFYALEKGKEQYLTSTAKFMTLWILQDKSWMMKRVISYDHQ